MAPIHVVKKEFPAKSGIPVHRENRFKERIP